MVASWIYKNQFESSSESFDSGGSSQTYLNEHMVHMSLPSGVSAEIHLDGHGRRDSVRHTKDGSIYQKDGLIDGKYNQDNHHRKNRDRYLYTPVPEGYRRCRDEDSPGSNGKRHTMSGALHPDDRRREWRGERTNCNTEEKINASDSRRDDGRKAAFRDEHCGQKDCRRCNQGHPGSGNERGKKKLKGILKNGNRNVAVKQEGKTDNQHHRQPRSSAHSFPDHKAEAGSSTRDALPMAPAKGYFSERTEDVRSHILSTHQSWCNGSCRQNGLFEASNHHCERDAMRHVKERNWPFPPCRTFLHCDTDNMGKWLRKSIRNDRLRRSVSDTLRHCYADVFICGVPEPLTVEQYRAFLRCGIKAKTLCSWLGEGEVGRSLDKIRLGHKMDFKGLRHLSADRVTFLRANEEEVQRSSDGWRWLRNSGGDSRDWRAWTWRCRPVHQLYLA